MTRTKKKDEQINLSKKLIVKALLQLMREKPYHQISITELTSKANLSRRTFYRHFSTIDEVLRYLLYLIAVKFTEYIAKQPSQDLETVIYFYFSYWKKHKDFLLLLKKNDLLFLLLQCFVPELQEKAYEISKGKEKRVIDYAYYFTCGRSMEYVN